MASLFCVGYCLSCDVLALLAIDLLNVHLTGILSWDVDLAVCDLNKELKLFEARHSAQFSSEVKGQLQFSSEVKGQLQFSSEVKGQLQFSSEVKGQLQFSGRWCVSFKLHVLF